jgi:hypothetical protein
MSRRSMRQVKEAYGGGLRAGRLFDSTQKNQQDCWNPGSTRKAFYIMRAREHIVARVAYVVAV